MRQADEVRRLMMSLNQQRQRRHSDRAAAASGSADSPAGEGERAPLVEPELMRRLAHFVNAAPHDRRRLLADLGIPPGAPGDARAQEAAALPRSLLRLLYGHEPFLACAVDAEWNLLAGNHMLEVLVGPVSPELLVPPVNVLRLVLHPDGMSGRLANLSEVHGHLLRRLRRQASVVGTDSLARLEREVTGYRAIPEAATEAPETGTIAMPVRLWVGSTLMNLLNTAVFFGTPWEGRTTAATAECLFPADEPTRQFLFSSPTGLPT